MRIDQSSYLNQITFNTQVSRNRTQETSQAAAPMKGSDTVRISKEAREAYESYALNARKKNDVPDAKEDFRTYLKKCSEGAKTPEDRLKELQEKLREVQEQISETAEQAGIANPTKQAVEDAAKEPDQGDLERNALSLSKTISPSGQAKLEALYVQMEQIIDEIKKVSEEL
ncbi:hypothetical protein C4J81_04810 [Deltaproteobacteria bacterium Smac51]|nr:hypothetical protein C4J81_04810 [Deltaproteobacteria bacterium Smac51]